MRQLDTSLLKVTSKNLGHISTQYGLTVSGSNGSMSLINNVDLKLDTEFDTEHDKMSLEQFKNIQLTKVHQASHSSNLRPYQLILPLAFMVNVFASSFGG